MGHSDISVTANVYTHTTDEVIADAADKLNRAIEVQKKI
jgi:integrase